MNAWLALVALACAPAEAIPDPVPAVAPSTVAQDPRDFWTLHAAHAVRLVVHGPSPQPYEPVPPTERTREVRYPSPVGDLRGWIRLPAAPATKHPAIVYFHGGFAYGAQDLDDCAPLLDAGFLVFAPSLRGENGNPGEHEHYLGELDDGVAAVRWLATQPEVDPSRIYTFGHSAGGILAGMTAMVPDLPVRATGSAGGAYPEALFDLERNLPFDPGDREERRVRTWVHFLGSIRRPHHAYIGRQDWLAQFAAPLTTAAAAAHTPLTVTLVDGDHSESLPLAMEAFAREINGGG